MRGLSWIGADGLGRVTFTVLCVVVAIAVWPTSDARVAVQVEPRTADELALALDLSTDVWTEQVSPGPVVVVLPAAAIETLRARGIPHRIVVDDIDAVAKAEQRRLEHRASASSWFADYRDLRELNDYMDALVARHPDVAKLQTLGSSIEGRPIRALEISHGGTLGIVLDGGLHAREWISVMVPICIADRLATAPADSRARKLLDSVRFTIVPVVNPDGYHHTWTVDRYWRKNRRDGQGVDLNRNFSVGWGEAGSSADPKSPNYRGEHAFSEPETRAMWSLFDSTATRAHIDFHSYSQVIVYPWSYQRTPPVDREKFAAIADRMSSAITATHGTTYEIRPGSELRRGAGGTFGDWSYSRNGALSFLVELRPASGNPGFVLPPEQIVPTCDESFAAVLGLAEWLVRDAAE